MLNKDAQKKSLDTVLAECSKNHLYGAQFDFEMVPLKDRNLLTNYYQQAAMILQKNNYKISFALLLR